MKNYSTFLVIKEMKIKITMRTNTHPLTRLKLRQMLVRVQTSHTLQEGA